MQAFCCEVVRALTKFGNRDGGQQTDDGDDDHDFNERET